MFVVHTSMSGPWLNSPGGAPVASPFAQGLHPPAAAGSNRGASGYGDDRQLGPCSSLSGPPAESLGPDFPRGTWKAPPVPRPARCPQAGGDGPVAQVLAGTGGPGATAWAHVLEMLVPPPLEARAGWRACIRDIAACLATSSDGWHGSSIAIIGRLGTSVGVFSGGRLAQLVFSLLHTEEVQDDRDRAHARAVEVDDWLGQRSPPSWSDGTDSD